MLRTFVTENFLFTHLLIDYIIRAKTIIYHPK